MMREKIRTRQYIVTLHADEEMEDEGVTIYEVEKCILNGSIIERQKDVTTDEWKYRIKCVTSRGKVIFIIAKLSRTGKLVIITVYSE